MPKNLIIMLIYDYFMHLLYSKLCSTKRLINYHFFQIKDISAHLILDFIDSHFTSDTFGISVLLSQLFCCPEDLLSRK